MMPQVLPIDFSWDIIIEKKKLNVILIFTSSLKSILLVSDE